MPYDWTHPARNADTELHLWPHQSLSPNGYVWFIGATAFLITVPLFSILGTVVLWGLLPFLLMAVFGLKFALDQSRKNAQVIEVLRLTPEQVELRRRDKGGREQHWQCNRYWAQVFLHKDAGPVPNYVTLRGGGREVEIGAFLSEEERKSLYEELKLAFQKSQN